MSQRTESLIPEQAARRAEGFDIVEWEYFDGSGSWGYCAPEDTPAAIVPLTECRVWVNGVDLGP